MKASGISVVLGDVSTVGMSKAESRNSSGSKVFDSIINMSISNRFSECSTEKTSDSSPQIQGSEDTLDVKEDVVKEESITKADNEIEAKPKEEKVESKDNSESDNISKDDNGEKFAEAVDEVTSQIKEKLKEILGITDEELEEVLSSTGFVAIQLLNDDNLKEFVVAYCGENEISSILTNENVLDLYVSLENVLNEIPVEDICQMSPEQLVQLADETMELINTNPEVLVDDSVKNTDNVEKDDEVVLVENGSNETKEMPEENDVSIDVEVKKEETKSDKPTIEVTKDENAKEITNAKDEVFNEAGDNFKESSKDATTEKMSYESFINNLNNVANSNEIMDFSNAMSSVRTMNQIVEQIVNKIKVNISADNTTMELMLNPEKLGKLGLSVTAKEGVMTASFIVESEMAKHAIEGQIQILKENLENQGIKVEAVEVTVSNMSDFTRNNDSQSDGSNTNQESKKRTRSINLDSYFENDASDEEKLAADILRQNGSTLDLMA